jgi:hypothetical protein
MPEAGAIHSISGVRGSLWAMLTRGESYRGQVLIGA